MMKQAIAIKNVPPGVQKQFRLLKKYSVASAYRYLYVEGYLSKEELAQLAIHDDGIEALRDEVEVDKDSIQGRILKLIEENSPLSSIELAERLQNVSLKSTQVTLSVLSRRKLVEYDRVGRQFFYRPSKSVEIVFT